MLDHRLDTKYAFSDRLLFPSTSVFQRIPMHHTDVDNEEAAKKAMELLSVKDLAGSQQYFGLYLQQLQTRLKSLPALNTPVLGDALIKSDKDTSFWMQAMVPKGIKLDMKDLKQQAAMPLASFLRFDPWTDQVVKMSYSYEPLINQRDKMPFEVEPVYLKLAYYKAPEPPAPPPAATPAAAEAAPATTAPAATAPAADTGAAAAGTPAASAAPPPATPGTPGTPAAVPPQ